MNKKNSKKDLGKRLLNYKVVIRNQLPLGNYYVMSQEKSLMKSIKNLI